MAPVESASKGGTSLGDFYLNEASMMPKTNGGGGAAKRGADWLKNGNQNHDLGTDETRGSSWQSNKRQAKGGNKGGRGGARGKGGGRGQSSSGPGRGAQQRSFLPSTKEEEEEEEGGAAAAAGGGLRVRTSTPPTSEVVGDVDLEEKQEEQKLSKSALKRQRRKENKKWGWGKQFLEKQDGNQDWFGGGHNTSWWGKAQKEGGQWSSNSRRGQQQLQQKQQDQQHQKGGGGRWNSGGGWKDNNYGSSGKSEWVSRKEFNKLVSQLRDVAKLVLSHDDEDRRSKREQQSRLRFGPTMWELCARVKALWTTRIPEDKDEDHPDGPQRSVLWAAIWKSVEAELRKDEECPDEEHPVWEQLQILSSRSQGVLRLYPVLVTVRKEQEEEEEKEEKEEEEGAAAAGGSSKKKQKEKEESSEEEEQQQEEGEDDAIWIFKLTETSSGKALASALRNLKNLMDEDWLDNLGIEFGPDRAPPGRLYKKISMWAKPQQW